MSEQLISQYDGTMVKVGNSFRRVDKGAVVPDGADEDHVAVLLERGMVAEGEPATGFVEPEAPAPPFTLGGGEPDGDDPDGPGPMPPKSVSRAEWDAWASTPTEQGGGGLTLEEAQSFSSKEALQQHFGVS
jgi:hypothetical protein